MSATILLLEDDQQLSDTVKQFLMYQGYTVYCAYDGFNAEDIFYEKHIDLMLLDVKVPLQNGYRFLEKLRKNGVKTPAIFITSLNAVEDVTKGFDVGCDDYIRKPFALKELLVRVESILKRRYDNSYEEHIDLGEGLFFNTKENILIKDNERVAMKTKEVKLLALFLENPNELLSYDKIFERLWEYNEEPSAGSLRAYVKTIRTFLGKDNIETIKNVGYRFVKK
ncbi:MAG: Two-component system response regulator DccR [uncultured Sulfurovum sp.]|uniref:Two-component system response regulator DccR n=1 Tax=uncultured Sulfurovum sp. TaxID=269237 RepID=A0A6S6T9F6_9BACT|nr:MAG: Two-component system response regulator DccR [uncultured Sulfurovum sp.]